MLGGTGVTTVAQACERTVAIFDGHTRYNLRLAFERFGTAHPIEGYQGQVVVCSAKFLPVAGYDPKHFLVTYLAAQHETEIWLAPLGIMSEGAMTRLAAMLPDINYDLYVLTGDYRAETFGAYEPALAGMEKICSILKRPIYGVLGNHDTIRMVPGLEDMGIRMLLNENHAIKRGDQQIYLAGIDDAHFYRVDNIERYAENSSTLSHAKNEGLSRTRGRARFPSWRPSKLPEMTAGGHETESLSKRGEFHPARSRSTAGPGIHRPPSPKLTNQRRAIAAHLLGHVG